MSSAAINLKNLTVSSTATDRGGAHRLDFDPATASYETIIKPETVPSVLEDK